MFSGSAASKESFHVSVRPRNGIFVASHPRKMQRRKHHDNDGHDDKVGQGKDKWPNRRVFARPIMLWMVMMVGCVCDGFFFRRCATHLPAIPIVIE